VFLHINTTKLSETAENIGGGVGAADSHLPGQEMQCRIEVRVHSGTDPQADSLLVRCGNSVGRSCTRQLRTVVGGSSSN
jgi:hypothetical protein